MPIRTKPFDGTASHSSKTRRHPHRRDAGRDVVRPGGDRPGKLSRTQPGLAVRLCSQRIFIVYKIVSLRTQDRLDVEGIIRRQGDRLDDQYVEDWLRQFEQALDDSTLIGRLFVERAVDYLKETGDL